MIEIKVDDMRAADKIGYVARIVAGERVFLNVAEQESYGVSRSTKVYRIEEDGIYEVCDANFGGRKRTIKFIKIDGGQIIQESENLHELILADSDLPELQGSPKQIDWATSIREKYVASLKKSGAEIPDFIYTQTSAKYYIDYRDKL